MSYPNLHGIPTGYAVDCLACELHGEPHPTPAAADQLAAIHDHIHHHGAPTAAIRPVAEEAA